jgi:hypothetical protein
MNELVLKFFIDNLVKEAGFLDKLKSGYEKGKKSFKAKPIKTKNLKKIKKAKTAKEQKQLSRELAKEKEVIERQEQNIRAERALNRRRKDLKEAPTEGGGGGKAALVAAGVIGTGGLAYGAGSAENKKESKELAKRYYVAGYRRGSTSGR